jgi:hypothetical protein
VDFLEPSDLGKGHYKVLIAPWHLVGKKATCEQLQRFVEEGGTLIVETGFGLYDENFYYNSVVPPYGLDQVFGYREGEAFWLKDEKAPADIPASDRVYYEPEIAFTAPLAARVIGRTYLTPIEVTSAKPIAKFEGMTVAATKKAGKGQVYYFGTNLGASIAAGSDGGIELLRAIITRVVKPPVTGAKVRPRLVEGEKYSLLVIINDTPKDQAASIELPSRCKKATDLHSGVNRPIVNNALRLTVPYQDAVALRIE